MAASSTPTLAFLGGTGPQGRGLAARFARAGAPVVLGSRRLERAEEAASAVRAQVGGGEVHGAENAGACAAATVVFVTVPYEAQRATLTGLAAAVGDRLVVCCVNGLAFDEHGPRPVRVPGGSAAEECAELLPEATVVGAFQNVSAAKLKQLDQPVEADVLVVGDDADARRRVCALASLIPGMRGVEAGPLRLAAPIEDLTAVIVSLNKRYRRSTGIRVTNLPDERLAPPS